MISQRLDFLLQKTHAFLCFLVLTGFLVIVSLGKPVYEREMKYREQQRLERKFQEAVLMSGSGAHVSEEEMEAADAKAEQEQDQ